MNRKRVVGMGIVVCICLGIIIVGNRMEGKEESVIADKSGKIVAKLLYQNGDLQYQCKDKYNAYVDITCKDLIKIVMNKENISEKNAKKKIATEGMTITTTLDEDALDDIRKGHNETQNIRGDKFAALISNNAGKIIACYSEGKETENYVDKSTYAGSTMKPLSVYAPGIERGRITWSSMFKDSPYMKVEDSDGNMIDWPQNTKPYTNQMTTVEQAIRESNNAIAVKVLKECGVNEACHFLNNNLKLDVEKEQKIMRKSGEDSILSDIALGYLKNGITMRELQSNYLMFGNGGRKYSLYTIEKVKANDREYYKHTKEQGKNVISKETAYIMNRLLKEVVSEDGTGKEAQIKNVEVCGKTGTSRNYKDNWFAGMTPEYVCSVWYEEREPEAYIKNEAPVAFHNIMKKMKIDTQKKYFISKNVVKSQYCKKTGLIANSHCAETAEGYYNENNVPDTCTCE